MDKDAINLTKAIAQQEGNDPTNYTGDGGTSAGAYQWQNYGADGKTPAVMKPGDIPTNFKTMAMESGLNPNDFSGYNQDMVAYNHIKKLKDAGKTVDQISSLWNAGNEDSWKPGTVQAHGNTPQYANNVYNNYLKLKNGTTTTPPPTIGSQILGTQGGATPPDTYGAIVPAAPTDNPLQAGVKSLVNVPSSLLNLGKSLFSAVDHPINSIKGIANAFSGGIEEGYDKLVGQDGAHNTQTDTFDALKTALYNRYGTLQNAQRTAENDPVGFGADVFSILDGGAAILDKTALGAGIDTTDLTGDALTDAQKANAPLTSAIDTGVSAVGGPVSDALGKVISAPATLASKVLGQTTGSGSEAINTGFQAATEGGEASSAFTDALRGNTTPEDLVDKARGALDEVVDTRRSNYKEMLGSLKSDTSEIDLTPLKTQLDKTLDNFNVTKGDDGELDFSESTLVNPSDQSKVKAIVNDVENWKNNTPQGIDTLKQRLSNYYEPGSKIGAFSEGLRSTARDMIEGTPGYSDAMKNYSEMSDQIKDIRQSLSLGDKTAVETSFNKLKNALKNDKQFRLSVIDDLDESTGGTLKQSIAGQGMSKIAPSGLSKYADIGIGGAAYTTGGFLPALGMALVSSPRIVGEVVNALGLGARGTKILMSYLNKFAAPAVIAGSAASK